MKTLFILIALATLAAAFPAKLKWNRNPEPDISEYRIYQIVDGARVLKQTVIPDPATGDKILSQPIEIESGQVYTVTAFNGFESGPADPLTVPVVPSKPQGLMVFELQTAKNLTTDEWKSVAFIPVHPDQDAEFMRVRVTTINR